MSIEQNIQDLTKAINELTAAVRATIPTNVAVGAVAGDAKKEPTAGKPATKTAIPAATEPTASEPAAQEQKAVPSAPAAIDFTEQIQKPIVKLAANGRREDALAILKEFGAARASEIKPEDYARAAELIAKATNNA